MAGGTSGMTKNKALHAWFNEFMPFYRSSSVPDDVKFPYGTYEYITGAWNDGEIGLTVNLWFYTSSEAIPDEKAQELSERIGYGGTTIPCDGGFIWIKRGSPWCQNVVEEADTNIKRRYINISVEYMTIN